MAQDFQIGQITTNDKITQVAQTSQTFEIEQINKTDIQHFVNEKWRKNVDNYIHFDDIRDSYGRVLLVYDGQGIRVPK